MFDSDPLAEKHDITARALSGTGEVCRAGARFSLIGPPLATGKKSEVGGGDRLLFAVSEMQGRRISASPPALGPFLLTISVHPAMEDAHAAMLTLEDGTQEKNAFFGIYDGHGGAPAFSVFALKLLTHKEHRCEICRKKYPHAGPNAVGISRGELPVARVGQVYRAG